MADTGQHADARFLHHLRMALHHLYDWAALRESSLIETFGLQEKGDPEAALRAILTEAIEALKPGSDVPSRAKPWRIYQLLCSRFIEQFTQREAACELGLSIRHLRREETAALEILAAYLWQAHGLQESWARRPASPSTGQVAQAQGEAQTPTREQELEWLQQSLPSEPTGLQELIDPVLELAAPLAESSEVQIHYAIQDDLPPLTVQPTLIRQALLTVLAAAIRSASGGQVSIKVHGLGSEVCVDVEIGPHGEAAGARTQGSEELATASQLLEVSGGRLETVAQAREQATALRIVLPAIERIPVLVIDDNVDTLRLLKRYLAGSRYHFVGTPDAARAVELATSSAPQIIVLDVMLPGIDGWELLGRLRQHPQVGSIPVVVCSILPQEELAAKLGASGFVRKPVTRRAFLSALDQQVGPASTGCR